MHRLHGIHLTATEKVLFLSQALFRAFKEASSDDNEHPADTDETLSPEEKLSRFVDAVCSHQSISYSMIGSATQLYIVYATYCRAAWCVGVNGRISPSDSNIWIVLTWPFRFIYSLVFPPGLSPTNLLYCSSRPDSFAHFCLCVQFTFYATIFILRQIPPSKILSSDSLVRRFDRILFSYGLPIVNSTVWLPIFLVPRSRTKWNPFVPSEFLPNNSSTSVIHGWFSSYPILVPGISPVPSLRVSFWGSWIFGRIFSGPVFLWWLFNVCNRTAIGFYNWETDQDIASADEGANGLDGPADNDYDGRMDGGREVGFLRRMWCRFSGVLVYYGWLLLERFRSNHIPEGEVKYGGGRLFVGRDLIGVDGFGSLWLVVGVIGPSMALAMWVNFLNYQHRLVVWRQGRKGEGAVGVVINEEDDEVKKMDKYEAKANSADIHQLKQRPRATLDELRRIHDTSAVVVLADTSSHALAGHKGNPIAPPFSSRIDVSDGRRVSTSSTSQTSSIRNSLPEEITKTRVAARGRNPLNARKSDIPVVSANDYYSRRKTVRLSDVSAAAAAAGSAAIDRSLKEQNARIATQSLSAPKAADSSSTIRQPIAITQEPIAPWLLVESGGFVGFQPAVVVAIAAILAVDPKTVSNSWTDCGEFKFNGIPNPVPRNPTPEIIDLDAPPLSPCEIAQNAIADLCDMTDVESTEYFVAQVKQASLSGASMISGQISNDDRFFQSFARFWDPKFVSRHPLLAGMGVHVEKPDETPALPERHDGGVSESEGLATRKPIQHGAYIGDIVGNVILPSGIALRRRLYPQSNRDVFIVRCQGRDVFGVDTTYTCNYTRFIVSTSIDAGCELTLDYLDRDFGGFELAGECGCDTCISSGASTNTLGGVPVGRRKDAWGFADEDLLVRGKKPKLDKSMDDPARGRRANQGQQSNLNLDDFMSPISNTGIRPDQQDTNNSFSSLAGIFGSLLSNNSMPTQNSAQRQMLEGLIHQLTEEAQLGKAQVPPASKFLLRNLPNAKQTTDLIVVKGPCAICMEPFITDSDDPAKVLPCKHVFHKQCITPWLKLHNTCPFCRWEVPTDDAVYERGRKQRQKVEAKKRGIELDDDDDDEFGQMYG
ncbi:hypothetical protein HDU82_006106 [Entophlyctis luteolus]|nr:hypothetical protein HDU82_006106 [Entophlyctis luteolus]